MSDDWRSIDQMIGNGINNHRARLIESKGSIKEAGSKVSSEAERDERINGKRRRRSDQREILHLRHERSKE